MWIDLRSRRTSDEGRTAKGDLKISKKEKGPFDEVIVHAKGERIPSQHMPSTEYVLRLDIAPDEVASIFRFLVQSSEKSDDFKRIAIAVANELIR